MASANTHGSKSSGLESAGALNSERNGVRSPCGLAAAPRVCVTNCKGNFPLVNCASQFWKTVRVNVSVVRLATALEYGAAPAFAANRLAKISETDPPIVAFTKT